MKPPPMICPQRTHTGPGWPQAFAALSLLGSMALLGGCATMSRGPTDGLIVDTEPSGAYVMLSNGQSGTSPITFNVSRKQQLTVYIRKEGFEPQTITVTPKISGEGTKKMATGILVSSWIGPLVDASTGAMNDLVPNPVRVRLVQIPGYQPSPAVKETELARIAQERQTRLDALTRNLAAGMAAEKALAELDALKSEGLITDAEFNVRRMAVVKDM